MKKPEPITLKVASPETEFSKAFLQGMLDRMAVSFFKYGPVAEAYPERVDAIASAMQRLERYVETGNTEYLIDGANFFMIEFMHPRLAGARFEPTDSDGSPGRIDVGGNVTEQTNADLAQGRDRMTEPIIRFTEPVYFTEELKAKWIEALESGRYKRGTGSLADHRFLRGSSSPSIVHCCLGVLADIIDPGGWNATGSAWRGQKSFLVILLDNDDPAGGTTMIVGLSGETQRDLADTNDEVDSVGEPGYDFSYQCVLPSIRALPTVESPA